MTDRQIRKWLESFAEEVFEKANRRNAPEYLARLERFVKENGVTFQQRQVIAESGAGEVLYMLTS